jgi:imidazolonepropionase-like amidohydrolase
MRHLWVALGFLAGCANPAHTPATVPAVAVPDSVLIAGVKVASPEHAEPYGPVSVRIAGGRIVAISAGLVPQRGERVIDGVGRYLAPGLIDSHTHLLEVAGMRHDQEEAHPEIARTARAQVPRSFLFHGFTTVIDLASSSKPVRAWNALDVRPQAYFCGGAPILDGYPMNFLPAGVRYRLLPNYLVNAEHEAVLPDGTAVAQHAPEAVAERIKQDGAVCVKAFYETGFGRVRNLPVPTVATMQALVAAAHARGLPVILHANSQSAQSFGASAGVDAFAHGMWTWNERNQRAPTAQIEALVDQTVSAGIALQPTIRVLYGEGELLDPAFLARPALAEVVPPSLLAWYATEQGQWFRNRLHDDLDGGFPAGGWEQAIAAPVARVSAVVGRFAVRNGRLLFGTDTPSAPTYANPAGLNGRWEMDRWVAAGVTPARIFRAATLDNAVFFGLDKEIGTVSIGKRADLLLLAGNPLESVVAFDRIEVVFTRGTPIERAKLSARAAAQ